MERAEFYLDQADDGCYLAKNRHGYRERIGYDLASAQALVRSRNESPVASIASDVPTYAELAALVREMAATDEDHATWQSDWTGRDYCRFCDAEEPKHEPQCVLVRARQIVARLPEGT